MLESELLRKFFKDRENSHLGLIVGSASILLLGSSILFASGDVKSDNWQYSWSRNRQTPSLTIASLVSLPPQQRADALAKISKTKLLRNTSVKERQFTVNNRHRAKFLLAQDLFQQGEAESALDYLKKFNQRLSAPCSLCPVTRSANLSTTTTARASQQNLPVYFSEIS